MTTKVSKKNLYPTKKYKVLVIDPPWPQSKTGKRGVRPNQGTKLDYPTMTKEELVALPVEEWAEEQSFLFLWATNSKNKKTGEPILRMAFELMETWGFTFYTMVTWDKKTGPCPFGPYQITTEHVLFGYKGKAVFNKASLGKMKTCFSESATAHSVKPDSFYQQISKHFEGKKLDVFARQVREGFDGWGNEYGMLQVGVKKPSKAKPQKEEVKPQSKKKLQAEMF